MQEKVMLTFSDGTKTWGIIEHQEKVYIVCKTGRYDASEFNSSGIEIFTSNRETAQFLSSEGFNAQYRRGKKTDRTFTLETAIYNRLMDKAERQKINPSVMLNNILSEYFKSDKI